MTAQARWGRAAVIVAALVGLIGMHALVAPSLSSAAALPAAAHASVPAGDHGAGHDPAGGSHHGGSLAHLCPAVLATSGGLLVSSAVASSGPSVRAGAVPAQSCLLLERSSWQRPPPDPVRQLSISRT